MRKKAQGISVNVIIIAAIALLVLVILAIIFTGRLGIFSREEASCATKGGRCTDPTDDCAGIIGSWKCPSEDDVCCIPVT